MTERGGEAFTIAVDVSRAESVRALGERLTTKRRTDAITIVDALRDSLHETGLGESRDAAAQALR